MNLILGKLNFLKNNFKYFGKNICYHLLEYSFLHGGQEFLLGNVSLFEVLAIDMSNFLEINGSQGNWNLNSYRKVIDFLPD